MNKKHNLTVQGKKDLEQELAELIAMRPEIKERIAVARDFGDLKENEEYRAARDRQKRNEGRILDIQEILDNHTIIAAGKKDKVVLGASVIVSGLGREQTYSIVGAVEANPLEGKISNESPLGQALLGKKVGEEASFVAPSGVEVKYKIVSID